MAILQLVASRRGIAVYCPAGRCNLTKNAATSPPGRSERRGSRRRLYAASKAGLSERPYVRAFIETLKDRSFQLLPGISHL